MKIWAEHEEQMGQRLGKLVQMNMGDGLTHQFSFN